MASDPTLTLITPQGVYGIRTPGVAPATVTTELTALQYAARYLHHTQWSEVLRSERALRGDLVIALPSDAEARRS